MIFKRAQLVDRLEATGKEFVQYVKAFSPEEIHACPAPDAWTVHQLAAHVRDTEQQVFLLRSRRALEEDHPAVESFIQEEWNREHYSPDEPIEHILAEFGAARRKLVRMLRNATKEEWAEWAVHPKLGKLTLEVMAVFNYSHSLEHLAQLIDVHEKALLKQINAPS